jgi:hypothetical protein
MIPLWNDLDVIKDLRPNLRSIARDGSNTPDGLQLVVAQAELLLVYLLEPSLMMMRVFPMVILVVLLLKDELIID